MVPAESLALSCAEKRVFALLLSWLLSGSQNGESVVPVANSDAMHRPSQQQHPREYGGAVGWWVVVGVMGRGISVIATIHTKPHGGLVRAATTQVPR